MLTEYLSSTTEALPAQRIFVPYTPFLESDPELNLPHLTPFINLVTNYCFGNIVDAIIANFYSNYHKWEDATQQSLDNFVDVRLYHELEVLIMEEIDSIASYDSITATNAITAFDMSDGVLLKYIITTISKRIKDSCTYLVVHFLDTASKLNISLEYKTTLITNETALIEFQVVSNHLNKLYYLGENNALQHY